MAWNRNNGCSYVYELSIDMTKIVDAIIDSLPGDESKEWEFDGDNLRIYMSDRANADVWYCRQTRESPEEYEIELKGSVDEVDVEKEIRTALQTIDKVDVELEIDYDSIEIDEDYGPDPDRAYEEWRDRQWEGED